ncbi:PHT1-7 [Symbiodinium pilosum]|uniref:PHT1-7 protein n=1 Tax=Symbiodinium pilosum TaxID=2952 RepID=A0A812UJA8_SYMPI|nr:PHT1-7 [Symbiodinium pilosum]
MSRKAEEDDGHPCWLRCPKFVPACSNFSIQYNYSSASIAAAIMLSHNDMIGDGIRPDFPQQPWVAHGLLGAVFIGSVVGMLTMGYLGDVLGIRPALIITNGLAAFGALASSLFSWGTPETIWTMIAISRLIMGIGVGGNYPLSAAKAAEPGKGAREVSAVDAANSAAKAFFWQGPGQLAPYLLALPLLRLPPNQGITSVQFRVLLGIGAIPAAVVFLCSVYEEHYPAASVPGRGNLRDKRHWQLLVGTAGCWFLFDIAFYGTVIFSPVILLKVFGKTESLTSLAVHAAATILVTILGNGASLAALSWIGAKALNTAGHVASCFAFCAFALAYKYFHEEHLLQFVLLCIVKCACNLDRQIKHPRSPASQFGTFHEQHLDVHAASVGFSSQRTVNLPWHFSCSCQAWCHGGDCPLPSARRIWHSRCDANAGSCLWRRSLLQSLVPGCHGRGC